MAEISHKNLKWINLINPSAGDLVALKKKYKFHKLDLEDCLQEAQRPKIDEYENYLFIVLQFPVSGRRSLRYESEQLNIFIGQNYLITIHKGNQTVVNEVFEKCKKSEKYRDNFFGDSTGYLLYELIKKLFNSIFSITDKVQLLLKNIEEDIFEATHPKDQLQDILVIKKNIITLRKIILPQRSVIAALEHKQKRFLPENLVIYFDDVVDQIEKLWNILETQKEIIETLEDTNESLISHNINYTIKTLTLFSVVMLPLTFLTGLFGMNVRLPFFDALSNIEHFWEILSIMATLIIAMLIIFKMKKWL